MFVHKLAWYEAVRSGPGSTHRLYWPQVRLVLQPAQRAVAYRQQTNLLLYACSSMFRLHILPHSTFSTHINWPTFERVCNTCRRRTSRRCSVSTGWRAPCSDGCLPLIHAEWPCFGTSTFCPLPRYPRVAPGTDRGTCMYGDQVLRDVGYLQRYFVQV